MESEARLLEADRKARSDALDVERSFIVQAPAGSGKTELLIQRYLSLLPLVQNPEEVLAITFTRKAALEMQLRVTKSLQRARDGVTGESEHERFTLSLAAKVLERDAAERWNLIDSPGRMRIQTVDAFGAGIANTVPISSGLGGTGNTVADAEMNALYREAAAATLDYLSEQNTAGAAVERVLVHLDNNVSLYVGYIAAMLASREKWLAITGAGFKNVREADDAREQLEANLARMIAAELSSVRAALPVKHDNEVLELLQYAAINLVEAGKLEHPFVIFRDVKKLPVAGAGDRESWQAIATLLLTQSGQWRKRINVNDGFVSGNKEPKERLSELIAALQESDGLRERLHRTRSLPQPSYTNEQWRVLLALFDLLPLAVSDLRRLFGERGLCDHNEVALCAARALGPPDQPGEIALILDYQVQHLLVDEMQDTSFGQYELLRNVIAGWTPGDGRTVFCVGDPMQSIYRFRDAEVGEFLLARKRGIGNVTLDSLLLRQNFRSGENLVHWFNTVFAQVMPVNDDIAIGAISYAESIPVEMHADEGAHVVHPLFDASAEQEAERTVEVIKDCLASGADDDVAVLVRSRTQLKALLPNLRRVGIEYLAVEIDRLTDLPEIIDVLALTRALCHEGDRLAWLALLRSPWTGVTWADLHTLVRDDAKSAVVELCVDDSRCAALSDDGRLRLATFVAAIAPFRKRAATSTLRHRVELAWCALGGPALLQHEEQLENVYRFFSVLGKIERAGTLDDVGELESRLDEERVSSMVTPGCRLQIMTMHKAKGLQFKHVILPGLGRQTSGNQRAVLSWLSTPAENGHNEMIISPVGSRATIENDPLHQFIEATEKDKVRLELDRLLYVACTRAIKSLHLIGSVSVSPDGESIRPPSRDSLLHRLWVAVERHYQDAFAANQLELQQSRSGSAGRQLVEPALRRFAQPWQKPNPNFAVAEVDAVDVIEETPVEFYWVGTAARHAGTIVHRWLYRLSTDPLRISTRDPDAEAAVTARWAKELGVPDDSIGVVIERTQLALDGVTRDPRGQWLLSGEGRAELAITGLYQGRAESIIIDRVKVDDDGVHWIVDYKTSTHEGGDLPGFLRQESDRYRQQLQRYASIYANLTDADVRTALYFPLLQEFCEVDMQG